MILQYSSLRCNSDKCWLGEDFQCERCPSVGRSGTCCQPQNNADFRRTRSLLRPSCFTLAAEGSCPKIQALWSTAIKRYVLMRISEVLTTKACWDQGYSLRCCRNFKIKEIRFLLLWALHPLLWRYFNLSSFLTGPSTLCLFEAQHRTWNLFDVVFFVVPWFFFSLN